MKLVYATLALLSLTPATSAQEPSADFARLVPDDASVLVQAPSLDALVAFIDGVREDIDPDAPSADAAEILGDLGFAFDLEGVDHGSTIGLAWSISPMLESAVTLIVPFEDPQGFAEKAEPELQTPPRVAGRWVGLSFGTRYEVGRGAPRLLEDLPGGVISARVDLAQLITLFGPMIRLQIDQMEGMFESNAFLDESQVSGIAAPAVLRVYMDLARDLLDSADLLDMAVVEHGDALVLRARLDTRPGSPLASWASPEAVDFRELAARIEPEAAMQIGGSFDARRYFEQMWPFYQAIVDDLEASEETPPEIAAAIAAYMKGVQELSSRLGNVSCSSLDFGPNGLRISGGYQTSAPTELARSMFAFLSDPALAAVGLVCDQTRASEFSGRRVESMRVRFDLGRLVQVVHKEGDTDVEDLAQVDRLMDAFLGPDGLTLDVSPDDDWLMVVAGGDEGQRHRALQRLAWPQEAPPAHLEIPLRELEGANPGFFVHYDLGRVLGGMGKLMEEALPEEENPFPEGSAPLTFWWAVRDVTWTAGAVVDPGAIAEYFRQL